MNDLMNLEYQGKAVRMIMDEAGEPWWVAKDVCDVLGIMQPSQAVEVLDVDEKGMYKVHTLGGEQEMLTINESGLYTMILRSNKPEAKPFRKWVTSEVLPSIWKTGKYVTKNTNVSISKKKEIADAASIYKSLLSVSKSTNNDHNAAVIGANNGCFQLTGIDLLSLVGGSHLLAEKQDICFTPTEIGKRIGKSARDVNNLLYNAGLQKKVEGVWVVTSEGKDYARIYDTGKKHHSGTPVQQVKWLESVLEKIPRQIPLLQ